MTRPRPSGPRPEGHTDFKNAQESAEEIGCGVRWLLDGVNQHGFPHWLEGKRKKIFSAQDREAIRTYYRIRVEGTPGWNAPKPPPRRVRPLHSRTKNAA